MSKRKHFVMDGQKPRLLMCGKPRALMSEATTSEPRVTCRRCLGRMLRDAEVDYERHTTAAKRHGMPAGAVVSGYSRDGGLGHGWAGHDRRP